MADSYHKKEREKKRRKRKQEKAEKKKQNKLDGIKSHEFMYMDEFGNLTPEPPDPAERTEVKLEDIHIKSPKLSELTAEAEIKEGVVKFYNEEKHYGFITEVTTKKDYFVYGDNLNQPVKENDKVSFEIGTGPKGLVAMNVSIDTKK